MESVNLGDTIANQTQLSAQTTDAHLRPKLSGHAHRWPTTQSLRDQITVRIDGVVWQLPFAKRQTATAGEALDEVPPGFLTGQAQAEFEVEDRALLQTVYGNTYERVSAVDERGVLLSAVDIHA